MTEQHVASKEALDFRKTEQELRRIEKRYNEYWESPEIDIDIANTLVDEVPSLIAEVRRLREENERWKKTAESACENLIKETRVLKKEIARLEEGYDNLAVEQQKLIEGYKKILEYPLTGAEYADIAEAMRYRQIARTALEEVGELEKRQTHNDQTGNGGDTQRI